MNKILVTFLVGVFGLLQISNIYSFDVPTHRVLSVRAVRLSNLDNFLKTQLGLSGGVDEIVSQKSIIDWGEEGSALEDDFPSFFNHFHNPLRTWDHAGAYKLYVAGRRRIGRKRNAFAGTSTVRRGRR